MSILCQLPVCIDILVRPYVNFTLRCELTSKVCKDSGAEKRATSDTIVHAPVDVGGGSAVAVLTEPEFDTVMSSGY